MPTFHQVNCYGKQEPASNAEVDEACAEMFAKVKARLKAVDGGSLNTDELAWVRRHLAPPSTTPDSGMRAWLRRDPRFR